MAHSNAKTSKMVVMFPILLASLAATPASAPPSAAIELVRPELAAQKVAACGFNDVWPKFDEVLQEDVIEVRNGSATDEQLRCVAQTSLLVNYYVVFSGPVDQVYQPLYWRLAEEKDLADAKTWLAEKGLLSRLPHYDGPKADSASFARSLEVLCGPKASGALKALDGMATFNVDALSGGQMDEETFWCLANAAKASGYRLGFIGNEAFQQPNP